MTKILGVDPGRTDPFAAVLIDVRDSIRIEFIETQENASVFAGKKFLRLFV